MWSWGIAWLNGCSPAPWLRTMSMSSIIGAMMNRFRRFHTRITHCVGSGDSKTSSSSDIREISAELMSSKLSLLRWSACAPTLASCSRSWGGHLLNELAQAVRQRGLEHLFRFFPYQDQALLKYSLCAADVHWISLRPELEGLVVPSKFYGVAAAGRPMIAITAKDGEIARLVEQYACGFVVEPGNAQELAAALVRLSTDTERIAAMGKNARAMLEAHFTRQEAFNRWRGLLDRIE